VTLTLDSYNGYIKSWQGFDLSKVMAKK